MLKRIKYACAVLLGKVEIPTKKNVIPAVGGKLPIRRRMPVKTGEVYKVPVGLKPVDVFAVTIPYFLHVQAGISKFWNTDFGPGKEGFLWLRFTNELSSISGVYNPHEKTIVLKNLNNDSVVELIISFVED